MSSNNGSLLPAEIVDAIIDQVGIAPPERVCELAAAERRATLGAFSLASSSCLPRSRFHLFYDVHLPPNDLHRCSTFVALLSDSLCTIAPYVRRLIIREASNLVGTGVLWFNDSVPQLALLRNVQTLAIFGARFDRMRPDQWSSTGVPFFSQMKMTELHLTGCQFRTPDQCLEAVATCQSLEKLVLRRTSLDMDILDSPNLDPKPLPFPPTHLTSLRIDSHRMGNYDPVMRWLACTSGYEPRISKLVLERVTDTETSVIGQFLKDLGPALKALDICVVDVADECDTQEALCRCVDLGHNTSLRSITFDELLICEPYPAHLEIAKYVPVILRTVKSPMRELTFRVSINAPEDLNVIEWDDIVSTIRDGDNWRSLERIVVTGPRKEILEKSEKWLRDRLHVLDEKIRVSCALMPSIIPTIMGIQFHKDE